MGEIRNTPQNPYAAYAAEGLRSMRDALDVVPLPEMLGGGLGKALIGKAPEEVTEWSYGNSPLRQNPTHTPYLPQLKQERAQGVADVAFLPGAEALAVGKLAGAGLRKGYDAAMSGATNVGRREFLNKAGAVAGAGAVAAAVPQVVKQVAKLADAPVESAVAKRAAGSAAVKAAARAATPHEFYAALRVIDHDAETALNEINRSYMGRLKEASHADYNDWIKTPEGRDYFNSIGPSDGEMPHWTDVAAPDYRPRSAPLEEQMQKEVQAARARQRAGHDQVMAKPEHKGYMSPAQEEEMFFTGGRGELDNYYRRIGALPEEEVDALVRKGGQYIDPRTGLHAVLDSRQNLTWFSPRTGDAAAHPHWVNDNPRLPERHTFDPRQMDYSY
jgi:hypothetical protein